jgi:hypothetical protein
MSRKIKRGRAAFFIYVSPDNIIQEDIYPFKICGNPAKPTPLPPNTLPTQRRSERTDPFLYLPLIVRTQA